MDYLDTQTAHLAQSYADSIDFWQRVLNGNITDLPANTEAAKATIDKLRLEVANIDARLGTVHFAMAVDRKLQDIRDERTTA